MYISYEGELKASSKANKQEFFEHFESVFCKNFYLQQELVYVF